MVELNPLTASTIFLNSNLKTMSDRYNCFEIAMAVSLTEINYVRSTRALI